MSLNFCIFRGRNPDTPAMICKAKKNKQEEFHLAFICCQIRCAFCLKYSYIMAELPIEGGFSHNTHGCCHSWCPQTDSLHSPGITLLSVLPSPGFSLSPSKTKPCLHNGSFCSKGKQHGQSCKSGGIPPAWGEHDTTQERFPLGCGVLPRGLVYQDYTMLTSLTSQPMMCLPHAGHTQKGDAVTF